MSHFQVHHFIFCIEVLDTMHLSNIIGEKIACLLKFRDYTDVNVPFLGNNPFIPLEAVVELLVLYKNIFDIVQRMDFLDTQNKRDILASYARAMPYMWTGLHVTDENDNFDTGIGPWTEFVDTMGINYESSDDNEFYTYQRNVLRFFHVYTEYWWEKEILIFQMTFWNDLFHVFTWWLLSYGYNFKLFHAIDEIISSHKRVAYLSEYWDRYRS